MTIFLTFVKETNKTISLPNEIGKRVLNFCDNKSLVILSGINRGAKELLCNAFFKERFYEQNPYLEEHGYSFTLLESYSPDDYWKVSCCVFAGQFAGQFGFRSGKVTPISKAFVMSRLCHIQKYHQTQIDLLNDKFLAVIDREAKSAQEAYNEAFEQWTRTYLPLSEVFEKEREEFYQEFRPFHSVKELESKVKCDVIGLQGLLSRPDEELGTVSDNQLLSLTKRCFPLYRRYADFLTRLGAFNKQAESDIDEVTKIQNEQCLMLKRKILCDKQIISSTKNLNDCMFLKESLNLNGPFILVRTSNAIFNFSYNLQMDSIFAISANQAFKDIRVLQNCIRLIEPFIQNNNPLTEELKCTLWQCIDSVEDGDGIWDSLWNAQPIPIGERRNEKPREWEKDHFHENLPSLKTAIEKLIDVNSSRMKEFEEDNATRKKMAEWDVILLEKLKQQS